MRHVVATVDEIPPGDRKIVDVSGRSIGIFNLGGEFYALRNRCPHQGAELCRGKIWGTVTAPVPGAVHHNPAGEILTCIHHGWEFHIRTGQSWCEPERLRVSSYEPAVMSGAEILAERGVDGKVPGPYTAETFSVTVEGQYVVLDLA
ncbi:MAG TPA: Rieske 2Fe-2S domain-containing protein [Actinopolymorphaceae bacterium]|jgi:3-phenylpropionate/trans-cinnamate dioxygenase ferredoxin subunit|nr:Rieske 2Fe-2S domain-containing protein [Actinopolymorphaceae bacterium]